MARADEHVQELLKLPASDRARAARVLLESLDEDGDDAEAETLRADELTRRARSLVDGTAELADAGEVRRRVAQRLREIRGQ